MPDFLGIGGQRCGTTWLYANLRRHPEVLFPAGKEIHYWNQRAAEGPEPWLAMFPPAPPGIKQGEITPAYAILGPKVVATIAAACPDLRLFLNVRNPMQRAWSASLYFLRACQMDPHEATDAWFVDVLGSRRLRAKSTFTRSITTWRSAFSKEQLLVGVYDDIAERPVRVMQRLARHLGIDPTFYAQGRRPLRRRRGIVTEGRRAPSPAILELLREQYGDEIHQLERMLERDLTHWLEWDGS